MGVVLHEAEAAGIFITAIQASSRIEKNETNKALNPGKQKDALPKNYSSIAPENVPSQKERIVFQASIFGCVSMLVSGSPGYFKRKYVGFPFQE